MITPTQITTQLQTYLPIFTDKFTETMTVVSAIVGASNIVTVTVTAHGKSASDNIILTGGTVRNPLSVSLLVDDTVQFTTKYDHDQTKPSQALDTQTLTLAGFTGGDTAFNGSHTIVDVINRRNITISLPSGETLAPAVDESQYLSESIFAGVYTIATVPTVDTFTIDLSAMPSLPVGTVDNMTIIAGFRIVAASDFKRAQAIYTKQTAGDAYLFVIMTDGDVSKDRHTLNDSVAGFTPQDLKKLNTLRNFSTVVFIPTANDLSGADAQDEAYSTIYTSLLSTLFGFSEDGAVIKYGAVPTGDGPAEYNTAYYAHTYDWQLPTTLTYENGFTQWPDVAFRDIAQTLKLFADDEAEMTTNIDLDDEEL